MVQASSWIELLRPDVASRSESYLYIAICPQVFVAGLVAIMAQHLAPWLVPGHLAMHHLCEGALDVQIIVVGTEHAIVAASPDQVAESDTIMSDRETFSLLLVDVGCLAPPTLDQRFRLDEACACDLHAACYDEEMRASEPALKEAMGVIVAELLARLRSSGLSSSFRDCRR